MHAVADLPLDGLPQINMAFFDGAGHGASPMQKGADFQPASSISVVLFEPRVRAT